MTAENENNAATPTEGQHPAETGATVQFPEGVEPHINELFDRNPLDWSDDDLERVVHHMRESRRLFQRGQENAKASGDKRKTSAAGRKALKKPVSALSLKDLGL